MSSHALFYNKKFILVRSEADLVVSTVTKSDLIETVIFLTSDRDFQV